MSSEYCTCALIVAGHFIKKTFSSLERLYLVSNKISKIENLDCCPKLNMLELGDNKIRKVSYASFVEPERSKHQYPTLDSQSNPIQ